MAHAEDGVLDGHALAGVNRDRARGDADDGVGGCPGCVHDMGLVRDGELGGVRLLGVNMCFGKQSVCGVVRVVWCATERCGDRIRDCDDE